VHPYRTGQGLGETLVIVRHALRNALLLAITIITLRLPSLFGGAVIIETMFQWPGMGRMAIQAIQQRDYPVLMRLTLVTACLVLASNLLADILYAVVDPRICYE
jgi:peptide/nickel transport system permease protein